MPRNLDIALLRTFVTVADHASMTAAGRALHITQSAVSQQVTRLEAMSGALFARDRRALRLTPAGERLLPDARRLLALNDALWANMTEGTVDGQVRLGAPQDLIGSWLAPILKAYVAEYPRVELELVCRASPELQAAVSQGELDLALVEEPLGSSGGECLAIDRLVWVGAKAGAAHRKTPMPISLVAQTCAFRQPILQALGERNIPWRMVFESGSIDATQVTVRADLAVTAWLASTVPEDLDILPHGDLLPELPPFAIKLYQSDVVASRAVAALVQGVRVWRGFAGGHPAIQGGCQP